MHRFVTALAFAAMSTAALPARAEAPKGGASADVRKGSPRGKKKADPAVTVNVAALTERLKSADPKEVEASLLEAKAAGKGARPLAPAIEALLARGTQAELVALALDALGEVGTESSSSAIAPYARHRNADIRKKALVAISKTGGPSAVPVLRYALSDPDAAVRGAGASGLGAVRARDAVGDLFAALDHDVGEAAASLGQLCSPDECGKLAKKLEKFDFDVLTSGIDPILFRPSAEIPDDLKVRLIARVRELGTQQANQYLKDVQSRWPAAESARVRQAIEQAVAVTAGSKT